MGYHVERIQDGRKLNEFIKLPYKIYDKDNNWVPPVESEIKRILNPNKNPYFSKASLALFNCYNNSELRSRIAVVYNPMHEKKFNIKTAYFGFFESFYDKEAVKILFDEVSKYCKKLNIELLEGPFNPNHYSELGMQIDKYDEFPSYFQPHNPAYYNELLTYLDFQISEIFHTRKNENIKEYLKLNFQDDLYLESQGLKITHFQIHKKESELEKLRNVFNDAFSENWHFLPVSKEEYLFSSKYLNLVTLPEHIFFAEYEGETVGAVHSVLDINPLLKELNGHANPLEYLKFLINRKKIDKLIIFAVGIKKSFQHTQVFRLLLNAMVLTAREYNILETTWMSEDNILSVKAAEKLGLKPDKQFAIYSKSLV